MKLTSLADWNCSIAKTLDVVGEWWTLLILRDAFGGTRRFDEFQASLGLARSVLTARLEKLTDHGILERRAYTQHPPRYEYHLTEKGRALFPVGTALLTWGDKWAPTPRRTAGPACPRHLREHHRPGADLPALPHRGQRRQHPRPARPGQQPARRGGRRRVSGMSPSGICQGSPHAECEVTPDPRHRPGRGGDGEPASVFQRRRSHPTVRCRSARPGP